MNHPRILASLAVLVFSGAASAQLNMIPGTDVQLGILGNVTFEGSVGTTNALSMSTTSCNPGSVNVPWMAAMQENHPFIGFMIAREDPGDGRFVQISNRSWLKHGFFALSSNQCNYGCSGTNGTALGVGCSDTYGSGLNASRTYLGPPEEIDPWLGEWQAFGSYFDCPTGVGCDGNQSSSGSGFNAVEHRVQVEDSELGIAGADYYYYGYYVVRAEPEANRENNGTSRPMSVVASGSNWNVSPTGPQLDGTVLQRWTGATIASSTNNGADGRCYVAYKVTGVAGAWHYEYAIHNRDNAGGIDEVRIPVGLGASVTGLGFRDIDLNAGNQWSASVIGGEIVFSTTSNPLHWNTVYNFWFDSDAPPITRQLELGQWQQLHQGTQSSFTVTVQGPGDGPGPLLFSNVCNGDGGNQAGCTDCPCGNNAPIGTIGGCRNSSLDYTRLDGSGNPSVAADTMRFEAVGAPPGSLCVLNSGDSVAPTNVANPCFGLPTGVQSSLFDGLRCAVGNVQRHGSRVADANGDVGLTNGGWGPPSPPAVGLIAQGGFVSGQTRYYQVIHRDSALSICLTGLNSSQAVGVTFLP